MSTLSSAVFCPVSSRRMDNLKHLARSALVAVAVCIAPVAASVGHAQEPADRPSGPAAADILQWFTSDRSLGCFDRQLHQGACTVGDRDTRFSVYYGDATGGSADADALALVGYQNDPTGNAIAIAAAYFHREAGHYRFVRTFPNVQGAGLVKGTTVKFGQGKVDFTVVTYRNGDPHCCPTGQTSYSLALNIDSPAAENAATPLPVAPAPPLLAQSGDKQMSGENVTAAQVAALLAQIGPALAQNGDHQRVKKVFTEGSWALAVIAGDMAGGEGIYHFVNNKWETATVGGGAMSVQELSRLAGVPLAIAQKLHDQEYAYFNGGVSAPVQSGLSGQNVAPLGPSAGVAEQRPRNVTLLIQSPYTARFANGKTISSKNVTRIYFATDGTVYIDMGDSEGVAISPGQISGSHRSMKNNDLVDTATISGNISNFSINERIDVSLLHNISTLSLNLGGGSCVILSSDLQQWTDRTAPNPQVGFTRGTPSCVMKQGRQMD